MSEFALLIKGEFQEVRNYETRPENIPHKSVEWFPVVRELGEEDRSVQNDTYVIRTPDPSTLPEGVPMSIAKYQFFQQLAVMRLISEEEAEDAVAAGVIPVTMAALIEQLPTDKQFSARMLIKGAVTFDRLHPLTKTVAALFGWTEEQVDDLFRAARKL